MAGSLNALPGTSGIADAAVAAAANTIATSPALTKLFIGFFLRPPIAAKSTSVGGRDLFQTGFVGKSGAARDGAVECRFWRRRRRLASNLVSRERHGKTAV